jgi:hypothetical protein
MALAALRESSRILSESVFLRPEAQIEKCYSSLLTAKSALLEALDYYVAAHRPKPV